MHGIFKLVSQLDKNDSTTVHEDHINKIIIVEIIRI